MKKKSEAQPILGEASITRSASFTYPSRCHKKLLSNIKLNTTLDIGMVSPARPVAFDVLRKVHAGGFASDILLKYAAKLDSRDAGLASEIVFGCLRYVFGCLRYQAQLDQLTFPPCS
jgi:hypothetical protein